MKTTTIYKAESDAWRHSSIGRLLHNAISRFDARVFKLLAETGHSKIRQPHFNLTRNLDLSGTRITELARRAEMTKQAMSELVVRCEKLGLVKRMTDPEDARVKIVTFTTLGLEWLETLKNALQTAENEMRSELGTLCVDGLAAALKSYGEGYDPLASKQDN